MPQRLGLILPALRKKTARTGVYKVTVTAPADRGPEHLARRKKTPRSVEVGRETKSERKELGSPGESSFMCLRPQQMEHC